MTCVTKTVLVQANENCPAGCETVNDCSSPPPPPPPPEECPEGTYKPHSICRMGRCISIDSCGDDACTNDSDCNNSCSVTATANPNPIPTGQTQTTISATNLNHTSLSKCTVNTYSLPYTFTQLGDSATYTVECTGDPGYNSCSSDITVTKQSTGCSIQLSADKYTVFVNENVKLTAVGSGKIDENKSIIWHIEDVNNCTQTANWNIGLGIIKICKKVFP